MWTHYRQTLNSSMPPPRITGLYMLGNCFRSNFKSQQAARLQPERYAQLGLRLVGKIQRIGGIKNEGFI
jgi:hypothetical protein